MAHARAASVGARLARRRPSRLALIRGRTRPGRRLLRALLAAPLPLRLALGAIAVVALWLSVNAVYQVVRKPTELFFPVSGTLFKTPAETWRQYGPLFRRHSTSVVSAELLAALAQVEASGNPVARTYWRWNLALNPFELYRPASSAVGMFQITDATFLEARRYCVRDHAVVEAGAWHDPRSCWFNSLYTRVLPSHAVELTAAYLDRKVTDTLGRRRIRAASPEQRQRLAAVIHLCGAAAGDAYAGRGFRVAPGQRCGDHAVGDYLARVTAMKRQFSRVAAATAAP